MEDHLYHFQLINCVIEKFNIMKNSKNIVLYLYGFWEIETQRFLNER